MDVLDLIRRVATSVVQSWWRQVGVSVGWAHVTDDSPLRVRPIGQADPVDVTPEKTIGTVAIGDRVLYVRFGTTMVVVGQEGGPAPIDLSGYSTTGHTHAGGDITSGTIAAARLPAATETAIGAVERATTTEGRAGTDTTRYMTPATVKDVRGVAASTTTGTAITAASGITIVSLALQRRGSTAMARVVFTRDVNIADGDSGNFDVGTIVDSQYHPIFQSSMQSHEAGAALGYCTSAGVIRCTANMTGAAIVAGTQVQLMGQWACAL